MRRSLLAPALLLASAATAAAGCAAHRPDRVDAREETPRDRCAREFAACASPAGVGQDLDVRKLPPRTLVQLAMRMDVGGLSGSAAKRLREVALAADGAELLELETAIEDAEATLGRCRCKGEPPELDRREIWRLVESRLPPKATRSPAVWTERVVAGLVAIRDLARQSGELAVASEGSATAALDESQAKRAAAERAVCETVHDARRLLTPPAFQQVLDDAYRARAAEGAGTGERALQTLREHARSESCDPPAAGTQSPPPAP